MFISLLKNKTFGYFLLRKSLVMRLKKTFGDNVFWDDYSISAFIGVYTQVIVFKESLVTGM